MPGSQGLRTRISTRLGIAAIMALNLTNVFKLVSGNRYCQDTMDCFLLSGYTCQNGRCICDPERDTGLFSCLPPRIYGDKCRNDVDCHTGDVNLMCARGETKTCRCRRGFVWDIVSKRCYRIEDESYITTKFDPVRDLIIPGIIVMTIGAMMYLGIKLFCSCGKLWQRGPRIDSPRELEECGVSSSQPTTWVASYRVFSSLERSPSSQFGPHSALHTAPCLLVPGPHQTSAPPPYEEALKHKVILSSYPAAMSGPLPPPPLPLPPTIVHQLPPAEAHTDSASTSEHNQQPS